MEEVMSSKLNQRLAVITLVSSTLGVFCMPAQACVQGYVWREAVEGDHVCVTATTRQQAWNDNAQADNRRQPGGGHSGFETCRQGYVWREVTPNDKVCVTPITRDQTRYDNSQASARDGR
jgi:hypothetical protein